jgi:mxaD protein
MRIDNAVAIARPPDQVWAILGDLGAVSRWVPGVASARIEGTRRICTLEDGGEIHEEIADFSDEQRSYSYTQPVHPFDLERSEGVLAVNTAGDGSVVTWNAEVVLGNPTHEDQISTMLKEGYAAALANLKEVVERS